MGKDIHIKEENGKKIAYEGNNQIGELHKNWDDSYETRNVGLFSNKHVVNVRLEKEDILSSHRGGSVSIGNEAQEGEFEDEFYVDGHRDVFHPDESESQEAGIINSGTQSESSGNNQDYGSSGNSSGENEPDIRFNAAVVFIGVMGCIAYGLCKLGDLASKANEKFYANRSYNYSQSIAKPDRIVYAESANILQSVPESGLEKIANASVKKHVMKKAEKPKEVDSFEIESRRFVGDTPTKYAITKQDYPDLFERLDLNGDGITSQPELNKVMPEIRRELILKQIFNISHEDILNNFVPPDNFYPDSRELTYFYEATSIALGSNHETRKFYKKSDWPKFFDRIDLNRNNKVTFGEFRKSLPYMQQFCKDKNINSNNSHELYENFSPPKKLYTRKVNP